MTFDGIVTVMQFLKHIFDIFLFSLKSLSVLLLLFIKCPICCLAAEHAYVSVVPLWLYIFTSWLLNNYFISLSVQKHANMLYYVGEYLNQHYHDNLYFIVCFYDQYLQQKNGKYLLSVACFQQSLSHVSIDLSIWHLS